MGLIACFRDFICGQNMIEKKEQTQNTIILICILFGGGIFPVFQKPMTRLIFYRIVAFTMALRFLQVYKGVLKN